MGCVAFHIGFLKKESACCESLSHGEGHRGLPGRASSLWQGSLRRAAGVNAHGGFLRFVTSLTRPVSLPSKMGSENMGTVYAMTAAARRLWQGSLFCALLGEGKTNVSPINTGIIHTISKKTRENSNLSVIFTGGVVKTTKIGIEIMAMFVYNYLIVVQGT